MRSDGNGEGLNGADVAAVMERLRLALAQVRTPAREELERIHTAALDLQVARLAEMVKAQTAANETLADLAAWQASDNETLAMLAEPPGNRRPWWSPKRWWTTLYRAGWGRQTAFNEALLARLENDRVRTDRVMTLATQLLGSTNALVTESAARAGAGDLETAQVMARLEMLTDRMALAARASTWNDTQSLKQSHPTDAIEEATLAVREELGAQLEKLRGVFELQITALMDRVRAAETNHQWVAQWLRTAPQTAPATPARPDGVEPQEFDFLAFEGLTRGSEANIAAEQKRYVELFREAPGEVLDGGCGRGEFLELLREANVAARGLDTDTQMVAHCRAKGLAVEEGEVFSHLASLDDGSLGGVFLGQVVEHLPPDVLAALCPLVFRKLTPGGIFVAETVNPMCLTTFSGAFYADPTHMKPIHPKALEYYLCAAGFATPELILGAAVAEQDKLALLKESAPIDPVLKELVLAANANFTRLNVLLYSHGNYALAARKP